MDTLILDLLDPEEAGRPPVAMKDYSDEFEADAVAPYESTPGATYKSIAADLGLNRATLPEWVLRDPRTPRQRRHGPVCGWEAGGPSRANGIVRRSGRADPAAGGPGCRARGE